MTSSLVTITSPNHNPNDVAFPDPPPLTTTDACAPPFASEIPIAAANVAAVSSSPNSPSHQNPAPLPNILPTVASSSGLEPSVLSDQSESELDVICQLLDSEPMVEVIFSVHIDNIDVVDLRNYGHITVFEGEYTVKRVIYERERCSYEAIHRVWRKAVHATVEVTLIKGDAKDLAKVCGDLVACNSKFEHLQSVLDLLQEGCDLHMSN